MPGGLPAPIEGQALIYATADGTVRVEVIYQDETFWLSQRRMAELFGVDVRTISEYLQTIFRTGELIEESVLRKSRIAAGDGKRYLSQLYDLDAVISVGVLQDRDYEGDFEREARRVLEKGEATGPES